MTKEYDILFGQIAVAMDFLTEDDVQRVADAQEKYKINEPIGELLVKEGLLSTKQLKELLEVQIDKLKEVDPGSHEKKEDFIFGKLILRNDLATEKDVNEALREQAKRAYQGQFQRLGSILVEMGVISNVDVQKILSLQRKTILVCRSCLTQYNIANYKPGKKVRCSKCKNVLTIPEHVNSVDVTASIKSLSDVKKPDSSFGGTEAGEEEDGASPVGKILGGSRIETRIGRGGMGAVYLARHERLNQYRAIKILPIELASNKIYIARFFKEAQAVAALQHPNIIQVFDAGEAEGFCYFAMEYVKGKNLNEIMEENGRAYTWRETVDIIIQVLDSFEAAHGKNIVHRDIKPDNIMISETGVAKVADFGLAKDVSEATGLTKTGQIMGTPQYMSPEQCRGEEVDQSTDIYSLGATMYTMLAGRPMFTGATPIAIIHKHVYEAPEPLAKITSGVPRDLVKIIEKMIAKSIDERYNNALEVKQDLEEMLERLASSSGAETIMQGGVQGPAHATGKSKKPVVIALAAIVVVAVVAVLLFTGGKEEENGSTSIAAKSAGAAAGGASSGKTSSAVETASSTGSAAAKPKPDDEEKQLLEKEKNRAALFNKLIQGLEESLSKSDYSNNIKVPGQLNTLARFDAEKDLLEEKKKAVEAHNREVDRRVAESEFEKKLAAAKEKRDWPEIRRLLADRSELKANQKKLLRRAELEEMVEVECSGKKILVGKYEVTNLQYRDFIESDGYKKKEYWSDAGWDWKKENKITKPAFWDDENFNAAEQPVVGVAYYEAEAYAKWAGGHLPSEKEWRTAYGTSQYPWGSRPSEGYAYTRENQTGKTVEIERYKNDKTDCGCMGMAGNVMEWCVSAKGLPVCCGGSWKTWVDEISPDEILHQPVATRESDLGFRMVKEK